MKVNEKEWIYSRIGIIQDNLKCSIIEAAQRMSDLDFEDFKRSTKSEKTINEFYSFIG